MCLESERVPMVLLGDCLAFLRRPLVYDEQTVPGWKRPPYWGAKGLWHWVRIWGYGVAMNSYGVIATIKFCWCRPGKLWHIVTMCQDMKLERKGTIMNWPIPWERWCAWYPAVEGWWTMVNPFPTSLRICLILSIHRACTHLSLTPFHSNPSQVHLQLTLERCRGSQWAVWPQHRTYQM